MQCGLDVEEVFLSINLYTKLLKACTASVRANGILIEAVPNLDAIHTSVGIIPIKSTSVYKNFCFVGTKKEYDEITYQGLNPIFWSDEERTRIDKEFEDVALGEVNEA